MEMNFTIYSKKQDYGKTGFMCESDSADASSGLKPGYVIYPAARAEARACIQVMSRRPFYLYNSSGPLSPNHPSDPVCNGSYFRDSSIQEDD